MIALTGATGHLGRLVLDQLLVSTPAASVVAVVRDAAKAAAFAARGVQVRVAAYTEPAALVRALAGVERLLLISSSEIGQRTAQHRNVIDAARQAGVKLLVYTSLLHADTSPLSLAVEHRETESLLRASGLPHIVLRNGWYFENHTVSIPGAVAHGAFVGSAGSGRIAWATRADYAAAAAKALSGGAQTGATYELAGDSAGTLADLAAEISRQTGRPIPYQNLSEAAFRDLLLRLGLPAGLAAGLAAWDADAAGGALFDDGRALGALIGRPTTTLRDAVRQALAGSTASAAG